MPGDFAKLQGLIATLDTLTRTETLAKASTVLAEEAMAQVALGFRDSRDPYGNAWAPLKLRPGGKPLQDTRRMQRSITTTSVDGGGFRIGTNFVGAKVHQYGATIRPVRATRLRFRGVSYQGNRRTFTGFIFAREVKIPARQYIPERELGPIWTAAFEGAARRFMSRIATKVSV